MDFRDIPQKMRLITRNNGARPYNYLIIKNYKKNL